MNGLLRRRPLFWKLLLGSWLTLILMSLGNAWVFRATAKDLVPWGIEVIRRLERMQLTIAAQILEQQDLTALQKFATYLPPGEHLEVAEGPGIEGKAVPNNIAVTQLVPTPNAIYRLTYTSAGRIIFPSPPATLRALPLHLLLVDFAAITICTYLLARYLGRPVKVLRGGIERVAAGDLTVRVASLLVHRRDEMAELAHHFDHMAEQLQLLLQAREQLLHNVSHELRSPLTRLQLAVDLARQRSELSSENLDRIDQETQRLSDLVGELLSRSRAEYNAEQSDAFFEISDLVGNVVRDAKFEAQAKGVQVIFDLPPTFSDDTGPVINGNPELLHKGIDNVVRNALKISATGQRVTVRLETVGSPVSRIRILVSDEGPGVPERDLQRIFEPFVRLENSSYGSGAGLGLAIARSAATAHEGSVTATNRVGGGLTVVFDLPVVEVTDEING